MTILIVRHITTYRYKRPVSFGEHRMMLRPRESFDQRVLDSRLQISPKPTDLRWTQDVFGNQVAVARFAGRAQALRFDSTIRVDHSAADIVDMDIEGFPVPIRSPMGQKRCRISSASLNGSSQTPTTGSTSGSASSYGTVVRSTRARCLRI
jgi:transglutaminase-like putative cysteine protease